MRIIPASLIGVLVATTLLTAPPAFAAPPDPPSLTTIRSELATIPTKVETGSTGYSRALFPHWTTRAGSCDTRETIDHRDAGQARRRKTTKALQGEQVGIRDLPDVLTSWKCGSRR